MHQLSFYPRNAVVLSKLKPCNPPEFSDIKNMLKDQLVKTSAFHFDKWVLGPELFLGLSRPQICIMGKIFGVPNKSLATFFECQPFKSRFFFFGLYKVACVFNARINPQSNRLCNLKGLLVFTNRLNYTQTNNGARVEPRTS